MKTTAELLDTTSLPLPAKPSSRLQTILTRLGMGFLALLLLGFLVPKRVAMPVAGEGPNDWNAKSFWFEPWGRSGVHRGVDIFFAPEGRAVRAATPGVVLSRGTFAQGGNVVIVQ